MEQTNKNMLYVSIDGNNTGKILERFILSSDPDGLAEFSGRMSDRIQDLSFYIHSNGGAIIMSGGDNILAEVPSLLVSSLLQKVDQSEDCDIQFSVGVGNSMISSYLALKYVKSLKKKRSVYYDGLSFQNFSDI